MLKFIPADKLKDDFDVFGHFYSIELRSGERIECRSVLEIITKGAKPSNADSLIDNTPDAIFIMMNPGSSKPLYAVNNLVSEASVSQLKVSLVPTKPDTTQYQLMRVMHYLSWTHVRVLNISDMREPKSANFVNRFCEIEKRTGFTGHSVFADDRYNELGRKLNKRIRPSFAPGALALIWTRLSRDV